MKKILLGAVALTMFGAGAASAADLAARPYTKAPPMAVAATYDWSGFYIGVHGGGGWADPSGVYDTGTNPGPIDFGIFQKSFALVGGQVGFNIQSGMWVYGIEGDGSYAFRDSDKIFPIANFGAATTTLNTHVNDMFSIRARLGIAQNNWLFYGTAGWGQVDYALTAFQTPVIDTGFNGTTHYRRNGAVVGAGVEYGWNHVVFGLGYLHYFTGFTHAFGASEIVDSDVGDVLRFRDVDVIRGSISYKFNWAQPVVAKY